MYVRTVREPAFWDPVTARLDPAQTHIVLIVLRNPASLRRTALVQHKKQIMNNRLAELSSAAIWAHPDADLEAANGGGGEVEMASNQPKHMQEFFSWVDEIKSDLDRIETAARKIGKINDSTLQATTTEEEKQLSSQLKRVIQENNERARRTKELLGLLKKQNEKFKSERTAKGSDLRYVRIEHGCETAPRHYYCKMTK